MKVGIDVSSLHVLSKQRGIGVYAQSLIEGLKKYTDVQVVVIEEPRQHPEVDLIHYPFFDLFRPTLKVVSLPTVVTIHDATPLVFPEHYPPGIRGKLNLFRQEQALKKVAAVITDSQASKKDVIKYLKVDERKIFPIYLAAGEQFKPVKLPSLLKEVANKYHLPKKFALYYGNINWNKNLLNLTEATIKAGIDLVLAGGGFTTRDNLDHPELKSFAQFVEKYSQHPQVHILGFIPADDLVIMVNLAQVVLLPSFYEGFGLPIVEAQACGTPVVTSDVSSMPEVAGKGAILVNPHHVDQIAQAIKDVMSNSALRQDLINKGFTNVKRFSWQKTAHETVQVYHHVLTA